MTEHTPIAPYLQRLLRVAFQDVDLYTPLDRSEPDRVRAAKHLAELESLLIDRLVSLLPRDADADAAAIADVLCTVRNQYLHLLRERVGARLLEAPFPTATWGCARADSGFVEDRSWEQRTARVVIDRLAHPPPKSDVARELSDEELQALAGERLVLSFGK